VLIINSTNINENLYSAIKKIFVGWEENQIFSRAEAGSHPTLPFAIRISYQLPMLSRTLTLVPS
jgi:hypothetical protein